jgi:hypothetical protein
MQESVMSDAVATATPEADPAFIAPVPPPTLLQASSKGRMDQPSKRIRDQEWRSFIRERRRQYDAASAHHGAASIPDPCGEAPSDLTGIALSGGGIRSATFALGVLQALARHDLLHRFDYLSTVSGGGYIGASLTWLTSKQIVDAARQREPDHAGTGAAAPALPRDGFGLRPHVPDGALEVGPAANGGATAPFPYGTDDPREAPEPDGSRAEGAMLRYLRQHGNYLTPGKGITLTSIIVVLLRGIVLNLLVWIPILAAVMWLLIVASQHRLPDALLAWVPAGAMDLVISISPPLRRNGELDLFGPEPKETPLIAFGSMLAAVIVLSALCVGAFAVYSLVTWLGHKSSNWFLGGTKYGWRRQFERWMRVPFWAIGVLLLLASVPFVVGSLHGWVLGSSFSLMGLASGLLAFLKTMQRPKSRAEEQASWAIPTSWIASVGAGFLLYGVLLVAYAFGWWAAQGSAVLGVSPGVILGFAVVVAIATGRFVDLNLITIHRFYRDRLMEAYLPDVDKALRNETDAAQQADSAALSTMCDPSRPVGPYHIINASLVLTESDERTYRMRGGDSFILSPLYCGSNATGWQPTREYMGDELTLPTAMAISGAAANPWTGSGGVGLTRNPLVSMLMALMNLRLGCWLPNPNDAHRPRRRSCKKSFRAHHFEPGLKEVLGLNLRETSPVCLLSDGGHFENLGLYELIRRRLRLIVLCDGTADPDYSFADLQNAVARIGADFGARIEFDKETMLKRFMPSIDAVYPRGAWLSESAYAVAQIIYADGRTGHLVYLTTALCKGVRLKLLGYKGANYDFPDQSTVDQFFDEEQFEAYRELGYGIADGFILHDMQNGSILGQSIRTRRYPQAAE